MNQHEQMVEEVNLNACEWHTQTKKCVLGRSWIVLNIVVVHVDLLSMDVMILSVRLKGTLFNVNELNHNILS